MVYFVPQKKYEEYFYSTRIKTLILFFISSIFSFTLKAQVSLTKNGNPVSRILVDKNDSIDLKAATLLQDFIETKIFLKIVTVK